MNSALFSLNENIILKLVHLRLVTLQYWYSTGDFNSYDSKRTSARVDIVRKQPG